MPRRRKDSKADDDKGIDPDDIPAATGESNEEIPVLIRVPEESLPPVRTKAERPSNIVRRIGGTSGSGSVKRLEVVPADVEIENFQRIPEPPPPDPEEIALANPAPANVETIWGNEHRKHTPLPWKRILLAGLCVTALIIGALTYSANSDERTSSSGASLASNQKEAASDLEANQTVKRMEEVVRAYCAASTTDELMRYVRQPNYVRPFVQAHYPEGKVPASRIQRVSLEPLTVENRGDLWIAHTDSGTGIDRTLVLQMMPDGQPLVDWETDVIHQPMNWDTFATNFPIDTPLSFRVNVEEGVLFSHEFQDSKRWASFKLTAPNALHTLYGYTEADGELAKKLRNYLKENQGQPFPMILQLVRPKGTQSPYGVVIKEFLSPHWLYLKEPHPGS